MTSVLFVRGCPRSGTTLLADVLNEDPRIALMVEYPFGKLVGELLPMLSYEHHLHQKFSKPLENAAAPTTGDDFFSPVANGPRLAFPRRYPTMQRFPEIVKSVIETAFEKSNIAIMGSKTPGRWVASDFDGVTEIFGPPKVVFVVRNPRDTVNSILNRRNLTRAGRDKWEFETVEQAIDVYHEATAQLMSCALERPNQTFVVGYEELLAKPAETLGKLGAFLDIDLRDRSGLIQGASPHGKSVLTDAEEEIVRATFRGALETWDQRQFTGDAARAAAALGDCLMKPVDDRTYRFDSWDAPRGLFGAGFSETSTDGIWSDGDVADIFVSMPAGIYAITLELAGFMPTPESPAVECEMKLSDALECKLKFVHMRGMALNFGQVELKRAGTQRLSFRFKGLKQACEVGGDPMDARRLGVCVRAFRIHRTGEAGGA